MLDSTTSLPPRRPDLVLSPRAGQGGYVLKDPRSGEYYRLGEQEAFLLVQLDGQQTADGIRNAFSSRFGEPLSDEDLEEFLNLARSQQFLQNGAAPTTPVATTTLPPSGANSAAPPAPAALRQSWLYWRKPLFDPDRLFNWLAPRIALVWTQGFLVLTLLLILSAVAVAWTNQEELVTYFAGALRWQTLLVVWFTLLLVTTCHEFAHGLTCKHFGGEVHEVGFLLVCLMPCLYCNVSDAWLFPQKSRRLWVTLAGGYCDLIVWALAVFVWRLTPQEGLVNYLAWVVLTVVGARVLMNCNPLLKLDGYYLLSDWLEIPNLQQRAWAHVMSRARALLWGAPWPVPDPRASALVAYGALSWLFSVCLLALILVSFMRYLGAEGGLLGAALVLPLGALTLRGPLGGLTNGEVRAMFSSRPRRALTWGFLAAGLGVFLGSGEVADRAGGSFVLRPGTHAEVRAPVAGFLRVVYCDEGDHVGAGTLVATLEIPNLESRLVQKRAEVREAEARLKLLEVGPRPEEVTAQQRRIERARSWRDLAELDLGRAHQALDADLARLDRQVAQYRAEWENARDDLHQAEQLRGNRVISGDEYRAAVKREQVCRAQLDQAVAQKRSREALGVQEAEAELVRRKRELAEAEAVLTLLEAGSRPEDVEAERAHLARVREELNYEEGLLARSQLRTPVGGIVTTGRFRDQVGVYFREGDLICEVEDPTALEAEVALSEQDVESVAPGQQVELKLQAMPLQKFSGQVLGVAPRAVRTGLQTDVPVRCRLESTGAELRSGMTGHARIDVGRRPVRQVVLNRALRFLRAEFWW